MLAIVDTLCDLLFVASILFADCKTTCSTALPQADKGPLAVEPPTFFDYEGIKRRLNLHRANIELELREPVQFFEQTTRWYVDEHLWHLTLRCDLATGASQTLMSSFDVLAMECCTFVMGFPRSSVRVIVQQ